MDLLKFQQQCIQFFVEQSKRHILKREMFYCLGGFFPNFSPIFPFVIFIITIVKTKGHEDK